MPSLATPLQAEVHQFEEGGVWVELRRMHKNSIRGFTV